MELKSDISAIDSGRPWQGTVLGILCILALMGIGASLILSLLFFFGIGFLDGYSMGFGGIPWGFGFGMNSWLFLPMILLSTFPMLILQYFITKGVFSGQKWTIIAVMVITGIYILNMGSLLFFLPFYGLSYLAILALLIYLSIKCFKHPFYNRLQPNEHAPKVG